jgi:hypothetical protein
MKRVLLFILPIVAALLFYGAKSANTQTKTNITLKQKLKDKIDKEYLENAIKKAIKDREFQEAQSYIALSSTLNIAIDSKLKKELKKRQSSIDEYFKKGQDFIKGFISGKSQNGASLAGSVASDFSIVGDARDIYKEGSHYIKDEPYDKFTLSLSMLGVGLSVATISTFGAAAVPKAAVSVLKSAKKSKAISKNFSKIIAKKLEKSVDLKVLKSIDLSSISSIKKSSKAIKKAINPKPIKALLKDINTIKKNTSTVDAIKILRYIDNQKELQEAIKITTRYKKSSLAIFKSLGKGVFRTTKFIVKKSALYLPMIIGLFITLFLWIVLLLKAIKSILF